MTEFPNLLDQSLNSEALLEIGARLSKGMANRLTKELALDPENPELRIKLLGYFDRMHCRNEAVTDGFAEHLRWFVANHPRDNLHERLFPMMINTSQFRAVKREWTKQIREHPADKAILNNAAHFCRWTCAKHAEKLWLKALELDPNDDDVLRQLSDLNTSICRYTGSKNAARKAVKHLIAALDVHDVDPRCSYLTSYVEMIGSELGSVLISFEFASLAMELGLRLVRAGNWPVKVIGEDGVECVARAKRLAPHIGYALIGLAHLLNGNQELAVVQIEHMTKFSKAHRPDLTLASRLIKHGENEVVRAYLVSCLDFFEWKASGLNQLANDPDQVRMRAAGFVTHLEEERAVLRARITEFKTWIDRIDRGRQPKIPETALW